MACSSRGSPGQPKPLGSGSGLSPPILDVEASKGVEWPEVGLKPYPSRTCGAHADRARPGDGNDGACSLPMPRVEGLSSWCRSASSVWACSFIVSLWRLSDRSWPWARVSVGCDMAVKWQDWSHRKLACCKTSHRRGWMGRLGAGWAHPRCEHVGGAVGRERQVRRERTERGGRQLRHRQTLPSTLCLLLRAISKAPSAVRAPWYRPTRMSASPIQFVALRATSRRLLSLFPIARGG